MKCDMFASQTKYILPSAKCDIFAVKHCSPLQMRYDTDPPAPRRAYRTRTRISHAWRISQILQGIYIAVSLFLRNKLTYPARKSAVPYGTGIVVHHGVQNVLASHQNNVGPRTGNGGIQHISGLKHWRTGVKRHDHDGILRALTLMHRNGV